ncbi:DoxX family protein [Chromobacterium subtsugae]|uniref:DoxX family protein n=1 Tax=Chromobacterium subtsugae TaxID=251747 RepID=A0ABS7FCG2_9NEIS|nr:MULTISPECIES: DoxX family protein [Chromobacterium]KUM04631.1 LysR family transcriptional regulator [Chromobacterium subtsugae]KZE85744.1 LysR family transcriptional regulator [Chromobacterium sp. F49]MBW7566376.1 DoxX family protein [Chromobacterium subtsugae]MBW8287765.1 DoxX family protein [Chromobacterium subtsugae]OBU85586.1 LysR family transcriptional regulator [Chromobacterium subtsugae]
MNRLQNPALAALLLRLSLGLMYLAHGALKLFVFTPAGTAEYFASLGLPGFFGYVAIVIEIGGGLLLLAGVKARWVALLLIPQLLGAIALVHGAKGWMFTNEGGGWEYPAFLIAASLALFLLGEPARSQSAAR